MSSKCNQQFYWIVIPCRWYCCWPSPGFPQTSWPLDAPHQGTEFFWVPTECPTWIVGPHYSPCHLCTPQTDCVLCTNRPGCSPSIHAICHTGGHQHDWFHIQMREKLLHLVQEHVLCMLPHAWWIGLHPIRSVKLPCPPWTMSIKFIMNQAEESYNIITKQGGGMFAPPIQFRCPGPFMPMIPMQMGNAPFPVKRYANWFLCFSSGFDVANGHMLATFPMKWHKPNHQFGYTHENSAAFVAYGPCTKGQHKTQFPPRPFPIVTGRGRGGNTCTSVPQHI